MFAWSPEIQGYILGSFFIGQIATLIPASTLGERFGSKSVIVASVLAVSVLTILIPPFSWLSASAVIVVQILRGFAQVNILETN